MVKVFDLVLHTGDISVALRWGCSFHQHTALSSVPLASQIFCQRVHQGSKFNQHAFQHSGHANNAVLSRRKIVFVKETSPINQRNMTRTIPTPAPTRRRFKHEPTLSHDDHSGSNVARCEPATLQCLSRDRDSMITRLRRTIDVCCMTKRFVLFFCFTKPTLLTLPTQTLLFEPFPDR